MRLKVDFNKAVGPSPLPLNPQEEMERQRLLKEQERQDAENLIKLNQGGDDQDVRHQDAEREPLPAFKDNINPVTGEVNGPKGVEPTRFGDWERKGRVTDF
ncbi:hypothetical protein MIR68_007486 [Amoeboaphelidium protococcarum]|nr:hypothetical protein MIR68_007486 [Amoeboaphelidium protococcarum]